jgi:adenylate cyclase
LNGPVTADAQLKLSVLEELHRAFDGGLDAASERQRRLLSYLVTEELEGRGDRLKAYSIATEVFGRPADFDPQQDSIVRVEVGRLRQALERYYLTDGKTASVVISIPKGQYRPNFTPALATPRPDAAPASGRKLNRFALMTLLTLFLGGIAGFGLWRFARAPESPGGRRGPIVVVAPFALHSDREGQDFVAGGLQADLADALSEYQWLTVIPLSEESGPAPGAEADKTRPVLARPDFLVRGALRLIGDNVRATVLLLDGRTLAARWTKSYEFHLRAGEVIGMQRDLVQAIARDVGNHFGIVVDIALADRPAQETPSDAAFTCQLRALNYWRTLKSEDYGPARRCFDQAGARARLDATSLAMDAILTLDPHSLPLSGRTLAQARAEAAAKAARAYRANNYDFFPRAARYLAALCVGDVETFRAIALETIERFPNNPVALADIGSRLILGAGDGAEGVPMIEKARSIAPDLTPVDTVAMAVDALWRGAYEDRPRLRRAAARTDSAIVLILEMALAAARGEAEEAARVKKRLADIGFPDQKGMAQALESTCWSQNIRDLVKSKATLAYEGARAQ